MDNDERVEAAALLRRVLDAVNEDRLDAVGPSAGIVRQIQGAIAALEALAPQGVEPQPARPAQPD